MESYLAFSPKKFLLHNSKLYNQIYLKEACRDFLALLSAKRTSEIHSTFKGEPTVPSRHSAVLGNTGTSLQGLPKLFNLYLHWQFQNKHHLHTCSTVWTVTRSGLRPDVGLGAFCGIGEKIFLECFSLFISAMTVTPVTKGVREWL